MSKLPSEMVNHKVCDLSNEKADSIKSPPTKSNGLTNDTNGSTDSPSKWDQRLTKKVKKIIWIVTENSSKLVSHFTIFFHFSVFFSLSVRFHHHNDHHDDRIKV